MLIVMLIQDRGVAAPRSFIIFIIVVLQGVHAGFPRRPKASDSLFVMANHGQLLEYSLDPVPDQSKLMDMMEINFCKDDDVDDDSLDNDDDDGDGDDDDNDDSNPY